MLEVFSTAGWYIRDNIILRKIIDLKYNGLVASLSASEYVQFLVYSSGLYRGTEIWQVSLAN